MTIPFVQGNAALQGSTFPALFCFELHAARWNTARQARPQKNARARSSLRLLGRRQNPIHAPCPVFLEANAFQGQRLAACALHRIVHLKAGLNPAPSWKRLPVISHPVRRMRPILLRRCRFGAGGAKGQQVSRRCRENTG